MRAHKHCSRLFACIELFFFSPDLNYSRVKVVQIHIPAKVCGGLSVLPNSFQVAEYPIVKD